MDTLMFFRSLDTLVLGFRFSELRCSKHPCRVVSHASCHNVQAQFAGRLVEKEYAA